MLPRAHRMTSSEHFAATITKGRRAGGSSLVLYTAAHPPAAGPLEGAADAPADKPTATAVGFVVSKAVGNSVVRHRVLRRLRAVASARLDALGAYQSVVVRALPPSAARTSSQLGADLDRALVKLSRPAQASASRSRQGSR